MITEIGTFLELKPKFDEKVIYNSIKQQIENKFSDSKNLIINGTWLGPQFDNGLWNKIEKLISQGRKFDNIFWLGLIDPCTLLPEQIDFVDKNLCLNKSFKIGVAYDNEYQFSTHAIMWVDEFKKYSVADLLLKDPKYIYINYNRKPKPHRIELVNKLFENNLNSFGLISLGKNDSDYNVSQGIVSDKHLVVDRAIEYNFRYGNKNDNSWGGIPEDYFSLGKLDLWNNHFLNIVGETEFNPWDNLFVSEKTWKPIIGLRPYLINGQTKIYQYLRNNGFKTFEKYFNVELEDIPEYEVTNSIVKVVKKLSTLNVDQIMTMYNDMIPDLLHNRERFFQFANEQREKLENIFLLKNDYIDYRN